MGNVRVITGTFALAAAAGCHTLDADDADTGEAIAAISTTATIPGDGACTHIVATRLADFQVSEYRGPLAGGTFSVSTGEHRITAIAYPQPCTTPPEAPPWLAATQVFTFNAGANTLTLSFHRNAAVVIDPDFEEDPGTLVVEAGPIRTGRNGEDATSLGFALDGWDVKQLTLPPGTPAESVAFSLQGQSDLPYAPRGIARLPDGRFVVQVNEHAAPLRVFSASGQFLGSLPVASGTFAGDLTDGIEAIDPIHLVRTVYLNTGDRAGIEILELTGTEAIVTSQIALPNPYNLYYPVGVTPAAGGRFAVTVVDVGNTSILLLIEPDGTLVGASSRAGDIEGLFLTGDGWLAGLDYDGALTAYDAFNGAPRPETAQYRVGAGVSTPFPLAFDSSTGQFVTISNTQRRVFSASQGFDAATDVGINLDAYLNPNGVEHLADTNEIAIVDRLPPIDPSSGTRLPRINFYAPGAEFPSRVLLLQGVPLPMRMRTLAYLQGHSRFATHYRRATGTDPALDAVVFFHRTDGTLAGQVDFASLGFARVTAVNFLPVTDELLVTAQEPSGAFRLVVTSITGEPRLSYNTQAIAGFGDLAQITSGPDAGDLGVTFSEPSAFARISLH